MKKITSLLFLLILATSATYYYKTISHTVIVRAENDDEESGKDHEDKEDKDDDEDNKPSNSTKATKSTSTNTVVKYIPPLVQTIVVPIKHIQPGYDLDTDGDGLVDALDPNPTISEKDLFTDTDGDGIANFFDKHPGEDDFTYLEFVDTNNNGINDVLEN